MKLILENWRMFLNEEPEQLEEGFGSKLAMGAALVGGLGLGSGDVKADSAKTAAQTTQQVEKTPEIDNYNALIGLADLHINSQKTVQDKSKLEFKYLKVLGALNLARTGNTEKLDNLSGNDAQILNILNQYLKKYPKSYEKNRKHGKALAITTTGL